MILNPAIIALLTGSLLVSGYALYAAAAGFDILRNWSPHSGSARQLRLERRTYLISTILSYSLAFELMSLFLFVFAADHLHGQFIGAMCAAGSLNANAYGYPALVTKIAAFLACGIWLALNHADNQATDFPLIRHKYKLLLGLAALLAADTWLMTGYFAGLAPNVITSCCGALFSEDVPGVTGILSAVPSYPAKLVFFVVLVLTLRCGVHFLVTRRGARVFSRFNNGMLVVSLVGLISFISLYFYEMPTHHCPFCILQKEYGYIGYPLYLTALSAGIFGGAVGVLDRFKRNISLVEIVPRLQKSLCVAAMACWVIFTAIVVYPIIFSDFKLEGY